MEEEKKDRTGKKSQKGYISPIWGEAPTQAICIKNCVVGNLLDVIAPYIVLSVRRKTPKTAKPLGFCHPTGGGPSHGHRQHAQRIWFRRYARGQTDKHTDVLITNHNTSLRSRGRSS